jgi:uncharacterized protein YndB with AHSA1/START domain
MTTNTIKLHRVLHSTPEKIYRAFLEPAAMAKWLPPYGFTCTVHHMEAKVGGTYSMSFTNFGSGKGHSFAGTYVELVPGERIRYTDKFDDPNLPGEMSTTITLCRRVCPRPSPPRCVISAGRNRSSNSPVSSSRRSRSEELMRTRGLPESARLENPSGNVLISFSRSS